MSTGQGAAIVLCGWEGNRRSGVALAMRRDTSTNGLELKESRRAHIHLNNIAPFVFIWFVNARNNNNWVVKDNTRLDDVRRKFSSYIAMR